MTGADLVSVIIPTRNSAAFLKRCIDSLRHQTYPNIEIIVVDNFSTDKTFEIAQELADIALQAGSERVPQSNTGAHAARGGYIYRVDGDFVVGPTVIAEAVEACRHGADAVAVKNDSDPTVSFWSRVRHMERRLYAGDELIVAARFFTRECFNAVGGFNEMMIAGEDYDLHNRLLAHGFTVARTQAAELHLGEPKSLAEIISKSFYYGSTFGPFLAENGLRGIRQISPFRRAYLRHWHVFLRSPVLTIGFVIMQAAKYVSGCLGLCWKSIRRDRVAHANCDQIHL